MSSSGHAADAHADDDHARRRVGHEHRGSEDPRLGTIWVLATVFVVWLFAIQTELWHRFAEHPGRRESQPRPGEPRRIDLHLGVRGVQFFSGSLLDRFGTRPLMAIAVGLVSAGAFLYAATTNFATLAVAQIGARVRIVRSALSVPDISAGNGSTQQSTG